MQRKKDVLILTSSIIVTFMTLAFLIFFFKTIQNKNKHSSVVVATLVEKTKQKEEMKTLVEKVQKVSEMSDTINSYFVNSKEVDSFVNYLESLGEGARVELEVKSFDVSPASNNLLNVTVSTKGSFSNTVRILMLIENSPYKLNVTRTFMSHGSESLNSDPKNPTKQTTTSFWRSEISFNVLTI